MPRWCFEKKFFRFDEKTDKEDENGCRRWLGKFNSNGYGKAQLKLDDRVYFGAHRVSWVFHHGHIAKGLYVLHKCDNPFCVNIDHLFLGTPQDNSTDMVNKGRQNTVWLGRKHTEETKKKMKKPKSEEHKKKLSEAKKTKINKNSLELIILLRTKGDSIQIISDKTNITYGIIKRIIKAHT